MRYNVDYGRNRNPINFIDSIVYSTVKDLEGNDLNLEMSIMLKNGNSEMKLAAGVDDSEGKRMHKPALLWVPGGGYRGCDKNLMVSEMQFLAEAGFVVASIYYRSSAQGKLPAQIIDVKTAIRFLRAHADQYEIDVDHIGIFGRSAGGHLSALAAMNQSIYETEEWSDYSSEVQACYNMFGPVDYDDLYENELKNLATIPNYRWKTLTESHLGAVLGGDEATMKERGKEFTVKNFISEKTCPMLIMHGDADPLVPMRESEDLYEALCQAGLEHQTDLYILKNGGHGTPEFFQPEIKEIVTKFFKKYLG